MVLRVDAGVLRVDVVVERDVVVCDVVLALVVAEASDVVATLELEERVKPGEVVLDVVPAGDDPVVVVRAPCELRASSRS